MGLALLLVASSIGLWVGCDAADVRLEERTDPAETSTVVQLETDTLGRAHFHFTPVSIPSGIPFSIEVLNRIADKQIARLVHEREGEAYRLTAKFGGLDASPITVECRHRGTVIREKTIDLPSTPRDEFSPVAVGTSDKEPTSFHYVEDGDNVSIEVNYETEEPQAQTSQRSSVRAASMHFQWANQPATCTHVGFTLGDASPLITPGRVEFRGAEAPTFTKKEIQ